MHGFGARFEVAVFDAFLAFDDRCCELVITADFVLYTKARKN
jgi:hypothetical protein